MDYYNDAGHLFAKIFNSVDLPAFAKEGHYVDSVDELPESSFGDSARRLFPVHDRANTYVSYAYAYAQREDQKVASEALPIIRKAAELFQIDGELKGLEEHIDSLRSKTASVEVGEWQGKVAAFNVRFDSALVQEIQGAGKEAAQKLAQRFLEVFPTIECAQRTKVASAVVAALKENEAEVPEDLVKFAGLAEHNPLQFVDELSLRLNFVPLSKRASLADPVIVKGKSPEELVAVLDGIDSEYKLARFYGRGITDPHRSVFNTIPKKAEVIEVGKKAYPFERWTANRDGFTAALEAAFGQEKAASLIVNDRPDLSKLSEEDAALLNQYLR